MATSVMLPFSDMSLKEAVIRLKRIDQAVSNITAKSKKKPVKIKLVEKEDEEVDENNNIPVPKKKVSTKKAKTPKEAKLPKLSEFEQKRLQNLRDNKDMLAKLLSELKDDFGTSGFRMPLSLTGGSARNTPKAPGSAAKKKRKSAPVRRMPSRSVKDGCSPIKTRLRRLSLSSTGSSRSTSPTNEDRMTVKFGFLKRTSWAGECEDDLQPKKRRTGSYVPMLEKEDCPAEDVTPLILENVAQTTGEKTYDTVNGRTCHQCRQKTIDQKTICRSEDCWGVRGQFCGPCLRNRYGEDAREALKNPSWRCPPCRGICNCSFCRKRAGKACTGILIHLARDHGFDDVNSFLQSFRSEKKMDALNAERDGSDDEDDDSE